MAIAGHVSRRTLERHRDVRVEASETPWKRLLQALAPTTPLVNSAFRVDPFHCSSKVPTVPAFAVPSLERNKDWVDKSRKPVPRYPNLPDRPCDNTYFSSR
jgi:hypothetical protein